MKIKLFTHTDLDGVGCAVIACLAFGKECVDIEYCNYDEINDKIRDFTASMQFKYYDKIYITDISVDKQVADLIEYSITEKQEYLYKYQLLDHHNTAKWLNNYKWAYVSDTEISIYPNEKEMKSCGTSLFYGYLWENENINLPYALKFIETVRRYDTWEWNTKFNDNNAKYLNDLLYIIGKDRFVERFVDNPSINLTDTENIILEIEQQRIEKYIESKSKQMFEDEIDGYKVGVVFVEQYHSQVGSALAKANNHLDFIIMIDVGKGTVSYRGIHDNIDLGKIASKYNGGGLPKAAGSKTEEFVRKSLWKNFVINLTR
jgi:oligoribonuclease NrnB/cAMP/cGMP phosphodiesterase (DHH superfamily)